MRKFLAASAILLAVSCSGPGREKPIGEAFVGPASLNLREELAARAEVSATVRHGERLEILERRRRFAKVRTKDGAEGWTDGRMLLSTSQMARLRNVARRASELPSQGQASVFDLLNVHTEPNRSAPSFYQIREEEIVDVIGGKVTPRLPYVPGTPDGYDPAAVTDQTEKDDWHLVRLKDGRAGWVLARMVLFTIPDEVAQYAEGHRITSYFSLGEVKGRDGETKHHWLWTTISQRYQPHHFDSLRVFVFNPYRKRYETAYVERNMRGYYPVMVDPPDGGGALPRFRVLAEKSGVLERRTYEFQGYRARIARREPVSGPRDELGLPLASEPAGEDDAPARPADPSLWERLKTGVRNIGR
mgnify:CR=1 FL=1